MASFGAQLKREREQRKISLEDISVATKIGTRFLRAIEENRFDQLPGGIFNKGFVRAYASYLGIDEDQAIADYLEAAGATSPDKKADTNVPMALAVKQGQYGTRIPWGSFAAVLLIVALSLALWSFYSRQKRTETVSRTSMKVESAEPMSPSAHPETSQAASAIPVAEPTAASSQSAEPARAAGKAFVVTLKARDDSWITITVDGTQLPEALLAASMNKSVEAHTQVIVKAGNTGALDIYFNDQKIPAQGEEGEVKTLTFDSLGLRAPVKPQAAATDSPR